MLTEDRQWNGVETGKVLKEKSALNLTASLHNFIHYPLPQDCSLPQQAISLDKCTGKGGEKLFFYQHYFLFYFCFIFNSTIKEKERENFIIQHYTHYPGLTPVFYYLVNVLPLPSFYPNLFSSVLSLQKKRTLHIALTQQITPIIPWTAPISSIYILLPNTNSRATSCFSFSLTQEYLETPLGFELGRKEKEHSSHKIC